MCAMYVSTTEIRMCIIVRISSFYKPFFDQTLIYYYDHLLYIVNSRYYKSMTFHLIHNNIILIYEYYIIP